MCKFVYPELFSRDVKDPEVYTVTFPDLPGAITEDKGLSEAIAMAVECVGLWLVDEIETNGTVPQSSDISKIKADPLDAVYPILIDLNEYQKKYGTRAIRKKRNITGMVEYVWLTTTC